MQSLHKLFAFSQKEYSISFHKKFTYAKKTLIKLLASP